MHMNNYETIECHFEEGKIHVAIQPQLNRARGKVEPRTLQIWYVSFRTANPRRFHHEIRI